jgi:N-acetylglucosaminyl-diphospho-decaprenol L-rhamnosyltransferase
MKRTAPSHDIADILVVVVSYNAIDWLAACLGAIAAGASQRRVEVVVVDNASAPDVQAYLATRPYGVDVLQQEHNLGFARACNLGAAHRPSHAVLLLNPDAVVHPDSIEALADFLAADPGRGLVGGRTLRPDGTLDPSSCWGAPSLWSGFCAAVGLSSVFRHSRFFDPESMGRWLRDSEREVDIVTGCLLLASRPVWDRLGGFDEDFFMYGEDADLSLRARAAGLRPSITPTATAVHAVGASSPHRLGKQRLLLRGKVTLARKHWSSPRAAAAGGLLVAGVGLRALAETVRRRKDRTMRTLWAERRDWLAGWPSQ